MARRIRASSLRFWSSTLASAPSSRLCFLAGSGISVPSGLPSGWDFNRAIAKYLGRNDSEVAEIERCLTTAYGNEGSIRFEQIVRILRDQVDPDLEILRCFDEADCPTSLHDFLARMLAKGARVTTTNFDSLIERAYISLAFPSTAPDAVSGLHQVFFEAAADEPTRRSCCSFARYRRCGMPMPAVLKLHGSLRSVNVNPGHSLPDHRLDSVASVGATLDRIGLRDSRPMLEANKQKCLDAVTSDRFVIVLGYSGSDDFDVVPSLASALERARGLVWIRHHGGPNAKLKVEKSVDLLPHSLHDICKRLPHVIVIGDTQKAIERLFALGRVRLSGTRSNRNPMSSILKGHEPYESLSPARKQMLAGMVFDEAQQLKSARKKYLRAAELATASREPDVRAYSLNRIGHIDTVRGRYSDALISLRRAKQIFSRLKLPDRLAAVSNAFGNVYLELGRHGLARSHYNRALFLARRAHHRRFESIILNNLGLVARRAGSLRHALRFFERALKISRSIRDRTSLAGQLGNQGVTLFQLARYDEALVSLRESARLSTLLGRNDLLATSLANQAEVQLELSRAKSARRLCTTAMRLEKRLLRKDGLARCAVVLAKLHLATGRLSEATREVSRAIKVHRVLGRREDLAAALKLLAECEEKAGKWDSAAAAYRECRELYRAMGNRSRAHEMALRLRRQPS